MALELRFGFIGDQDSTPDRHVHFIVGSLRGQVVQVTIEDALRERLLNAAYLSEGRLRELIKRLELCKRNEDIPLKHRKILCEIGRKLDNILSERIIRQTRTPKTT